MNITLRYKNCWIYPSLTLTEQEENEFRDAGINIVITSNLLSSALGEDNPRYRNSNTTAYSYKPLPETVITKEKLESALEFIKDYFNSLLRQRTEEIRVSSVFSTTFTDANNELVHPVVSDTSIPNLILSLNDKMYRLSVVSTETDERYKVIKEDFDRRLRECKQSYINQLDEIKYAYESKLGQLKTQLEERFPMLPLNINDSRFSDILFYSYELDFKGYIFSLPFLLEQKYMRINDKIYKLLDEFYIKKKCRLHLGYSPNRVNALVRLVSDDTYKKQVQFAHSLTHERLLNVCTGTYVFDLLDLDNPLETVIKTRDDLQKLFSIVNPKSLGSNPPNNLEPIYIASRSLNPTEELMKLVKPKVVDELWS